RLAPSPFAACGGGTRRRNDRQRDIRYFDNARSPTLKKRAAYSSVFPFLAGFAGAFFGSVDVAAGISVVFAGVAVALGGVVAPAGSFAAVFAAFFFGVGVASGS